MVVFLARHLENALNRNYFNILQKKKVQVEGYQEPPLFNR